ncbi:cytochrome c biogenesis protein CcdA [Helicobacter sp. 11S03491-1]|uniref:cytochrome c biogenesis protein CcdA n=1 Tax=Helicobacter sp. 11S03491-1 TaxID=1476196 RepID=UPI000BA7ADA6|nr:cytochrome c biogenesis protein CcdA [Helicobacter sp. 11S03491-1]PAF43065.1 cytochrome C biogenesis protein [Helicobacter sp. 11S03491-1]
MFDDSLIEFFSSAPISASLLAGILTFLSPCILPLIPAYMSYISGISLEDLKSGQANRTSVFIKSILFILGFGIIFILLGASMARLIHNYLIGDWLNYVAGGVIIIFGLHFLGIFRISFLYKSKKSNFELKVSKNKFLSFLSPFVLGISFALGWTPCVGPIFTSIVMLSGTQEGYGLGLMVVYTLGLGIPFLAVALMLNQALGLLNKMKKYTRIIEIISGLLLIGIGVIILSGSMRDLSEILLQKLGGM